MEIPKVFESEYRFCLILWEHAPVKSIASITYLKGEGFTETAIRIPLQ